MKYKLININTKEEHLCDKVTIDGFDYYVSDEKAEEDFYGYINFQGGVIKKIGKYFADDWKKVIATTNPNIDVPKMVDEVEMLAKEWLKSKGLKDTSIAYSPFIAGYNKSQETHPNSDDDMAEFAEWLTLNTNSTSIHGEYIYKNVRRVTKELIQIWKEQRTKTLYYE